MPYLTENQLSNTMHIPIALPATNLIMGNWITLASLVISAPMQLTYRFGSVQLFSSSVDTSLITSSNLAYGNLGFAYLALRQNYVSGPPGAAGGLDAVIAPLLGVYSRDITVPVIITTPGTYSWIIANNMQPSADSPPLIDPSISIDFQLAVTGTVRLELDTL
jgi:hypothetical protein